MVKSIEKIYENNSVVVVRLRVAVRSYGLEENTYILYNKENLKGVIIDPGVEDVEIYEYLEKENITIEKIILTHNHADHIAGLDKAKNKLNVDVLISKIDGKTLGQDIDGHYKYFRIENIETKPDIELEHLDIIETEGMNLKVHSTPGHTKGSICLEIMDTDILISGDTMFKNGFGRCDFYGGNIEDMKNSIDYIFKTFSPETKVFSGHGEEVILGQNNIEIY